VKIRKKEHTVVRLGRELLAGNELARHFAVEN
jgi:hypothetical protein